MLEFAGRLNLAGAPIVLLELPVGNSLPVKLIRRALEQRGYSVATILASLSRNDSKRRGVTRAQLLEERLASFDFSQGGLVLYIDEWESGSNFYNLCPLIARVLEGRSGTFFLPVGLLTGNSKLNERFRSFCERHDMFTRRMGEVGERWRLVVPPLVMRFGRHTYFFWSEHDRSAGYRKMQFLGSFISTVKAGVDLLMTDTELLRGLKHLMLGNVAEELQRAGSERRISDALVKDQTAFVELFHESANEFLKLLPELEKLEHQVNAGAIEDGEEAMKKVFDALVPKLNESRAKLAVLCSLRVSEVQDRLNPEDRYYYRKYAPVVVELQDPARRYHDVLLDEIYRRIEQRL